MHLLPPCFHRIGAVALVALLGCDRPKAQSLPIDTAGMRAGTTVAVSTSPSPADSAARGEVPPANDDRVPARANPPTDLQTPAASDPKPVVVPPAAAAASKPAATAPETTTTPASGVAHTQPQPAATPATPPAARRQVPFMPGEKLVYDVRFGPLKVGSGTMEVGAIDTVRGREVFHTTFRIKGGTLVYKVNDRYESWFDTQSLVSLRYRQDIDEGNYERERTYEIFPERAMYSENEKQEQTSVTEPLDDGSFIYFIRSIPLEVGKTYEFNRYFRPDRNPVTIRVLRKERVRVPAGSFKAIVVRPVIKAKGIFSEGGRAELWLADDSTRVMLQLQSKLSFGSLNLHLTSIKRP